MRSKNSATSTFKREASKFHKEAIEITLAELESEIDKEEEIVQRDFKFTQVWITLHFICFI